ncbi:MAG: hypothetical protein ACTH31_14035, partial [Pseudoclavibacter sp.]
GAATRGLRGAHAGARPPPALAESLGLRVAIAPLDVDAGSGDSAASGGDATDGRSGDVGPDLVVNTIPGGGALRVRHPERVRRSAVLFDVIYDPWPTATAQHWLEAGGRIVSGLEMLLHQAVAQVRLFTRPEDEVRDVSDADLLAAMRATLA